MLPRFGFQHRTANSQRLIPVVWIRFRAFAVLVQRSIKHKHTIYIYIHRYRCKARMSIRDGCWQRTEQNFSRAAAKLWRATSALGATRIITIQYNIIYTNNCALARTTVLFIKMQCHLNIRNDSMNMFIFSDGFFISTGTQKVISIYRTRVMSSSVPLPHTNVPGFLTFTGSLCNALILNNLYII